MTQMTTHERMSCVFRHQTPDRPPITDIVWDSTLARWHDEGLPNGADWQQYFGLDQIVLLGLNEIDTSPRFPEKVLEQTDSYTIVSDRWGITKKNFKPVSTTFQHLEQAVKDRNSWLRAKERMSADASRVDWPLLRRCYRNWRSSGAWITVAPWFGFDVVSTRLCDSETVLIAMAEEPDWAKDMFNHGCDFSLALLDQIWEQGYHFDELLWYDDMAYKCGMLFSKQMWRELVRPYQKRVVDWAHSHGVWAHLHCCGNINSLIPDLIDLGVDMLNPLEVKANMDPLAVKKAYGDRLALRGGFDARCWDDTQQALAEIRSLLPRLAQGGGYVFSSDHSIPHSVSLQTYRQIVQTVKAMF